MDEMSIRRQFITDEEWNRTSTSWKQLKPLRNFNEFKASDETEKECFSRLQKAGLRIPFPVIEQWVYPHFYNRDTVNNYGWIDYRQVDFREMLLSIDELRTLFVIQEYRAYVDARSRSKPFENFMYTLKDREYWEAHHTWRIAPVILEVKSFPKAPKYAELGSTLQLIEGHSRLGYLYAMENAGILRVRQHKVFLLRSTEHSA